MKYHALTIATSLCLASCYPAGPEYHDKGDIKVVIIAENDSCYHYSNDVVKVDSLLVGMGLPQSFLTEGGEHDVTVQCGGAVGTPLITWRRKINVTKDTTLRFPCDTCFVE